MKLSLLVPVFNEAHHLREVIPHLFSVKLPIESEWIFIDDKSTDLSLEILRELQPKYGYHLIEQDKNQGKGAAVIRGCREATGNLIMIQDADFEYDPRDIPLLLQPLIVDDADVVFGSRFKKNTNQVHRTWHYGINRFLTVLSNLFSGIYLTDMETCYKIFRAEIIQSMNLQSKRFGIEVELTAYLGKIKTRINEFPVRYYPRTYLQGKKINWKDGLAAIRHLIYFNFFVPTEKAFHGLPQKYLR